MGIAEKSSTQDRSYVARVEHFAILTAVFLPIVVAVAGSYVVSRIQIGPVYAFDVVVVTSSSLGVFLLIRHHKWVTVPWQRIGFVSLIVLGFLSTVALVGSDFSREAFRDYHSYLMLSYSLILILLWPFVPGALRRLGFRSIYIALLIGWAATSLRMANSILGWELTAEVGGSELFAIRADVDGWLVGLLSALTLIRVARASLLIQVALFPWIILLQLQVAILGSRAGHLSALAMLALAAVLAWPIQKENGVVAFQHSNLLRGLLVFLTALVLTFAATPIGQKHLGGLSLVLPTVSSPTSSIESTPDSESIPLLSVGTEVSAFSSGEGTARARLQSWMVLSEWLLKDTRRLFFGVGLGTDYFWESGARVALLGDGPREMGENRWPHNYLLTVIAQLGILGFMAMVIMYSHVFWRQIRQSNADNGLQQLATLLFVGLVVIALFGVVAENPYGSLPLAWVVGLSLANKESSSRFSSLLRRC